MVLEFQRYGLPGMRVFTGIMEVLLGVAMIAGIFYPLIAFLTSISLASMMLVGVIVRKKIGDPILFILPAALYLVVNIVIALESGLRLPF